MKLIKTLVMVGLLSLATVGIAKTPSDHSLEKLATTLHFDENFNRSMQQGFMANFESSFKNTPYFQALKPEQQQAYYQLAEKYGKKVLAEINTAEFRATMMGEFADVAKHHFSQEEVNALIKFYGSSVGQKIVSKQQLVYEEFLGNIFQMLLDPKSPLSQKLNSTSKKYQEEFLKELDVLWGDAEN